MSISTLQASPNKEITHLEVREKVNEVITAHANVTSGNPHGLTSSDISLGNVDNTSDENKPVSTDQQSALNNKSNVLVNIVIETTDARTLQLSDIDSFIRLTNNGTTVVTVPNDTSLNLPSGFSVTICLESTGTASIVAESGVTLKSKDDLNSIGGQNEPVSLVKEAENEWILFGSLT